MSELDLLARGGVVGGGGAGFPKPRQGIHRTVWLAVVHWRCFLRGENRKIGINQICFRINHGLFAHKSSKEYINQQS